MPRLGELLVDMGTCAPDRVREALEAQVLFGARLGTNLLELGAVSEEVLAKALSRQHGGRATYGDIHLDRTLLALLKPELADRFEVVPCALTGRRLTVLCCNPRDLAMVDELSFATGKQIDLIVVPEARLWALLRAHYGVERPMRGLEVDWTRQRRAIPLEPEQAPAGPDLMDEAEFAAIYADRVAGTATPVPTAVPSVPSPSPWKGEGRGEGRPTSGRAPLPSPPPASGGRGPAPLPTPTPTPVSAFSRTPPPLPSKRRAPPPAPPPPAYDPADPFSGSLVSTDEVLAALQAEATAAHPARHEGRIALGAALETAPKPLSFAEAVAALAGVADRGAIARVVLRYGHSRFRRVVLLTVHARGADGWEGLGDGLTPQTVARIHVPLASPGVVQTVVESRSHFLGPLSRTEANIRLLRALAGGAPKNAFAMPILARGKVVNVLYADDGRGGVVSSDGVGELLILASKISQSYDVLLERAR